MDPMSVLRILWKYKVFVIPVVVVTLVAALGVYQFGPRLYESTESYALVNPDVPTEGEVEADPALQALNSNNPYLRASNPTLITDVIISRLNDGSTADEIKAKGLSTDYKVGASPTGNGFVVDITGVGNTPAKSLDATEALSKILITDLHEVQTVNGADELYLYTALLVAAPNKATEQFSSRLRAVIAVVVAGLVLTFAAVSLGRWLDASRRRKNESGDDETEAGSDDETDGATAEAVPEEL